MVVGATGVLGRNVVPRLLERGHAVRAVIRRHAEAPFLQELGAVPVVGDLFDIGSLDTAAQGCDVALHLATAIPKPGDQDWSENDRVRRAGTRNLIEAVLNSRVRRYVQQSITLLYGGGGQALVDESTPLRPSEMTQSAADMEGLVRATDLDWCILRGGLFYGPGTDREASWRQAAREGRLTLPADGGDRISLVHVADMARAVVAAAESAPEGSTYNIVDDEPVSYRRLFTFLAAQLGLEPPPSGGPRVLPSLACSNAKARRDLGWAPMYPTYRSGLT